ncbi:MAG: BatD family protein [Elusimicrobiota bacterium]
MNYRLRRLSSWIFFIGCFVQPLLSNVYILGYTDKKKITIGDKVKLTLILEYTDGVKISSFTPEQNLKSFEIKDYKITKERKKYLLFGRYKKKYEYILATFTTGIYEIKPFIIDFITQDGKPAQSQTNPIRIEVTSLLDKESAADIKDIKPPVNLKHHPVFYILVAGIPILVLLCYFIYKYQLQKKNFAQIIDEIVDPYLYATDELAKLEKTDLIKRGLVKEFYFRLTQIVRIYLSKIFLVNIIDMTTSESIKALREKSVDKKFLVILREFFEFSDLVKFARYIPEEKDIIQSFENARNIVEMVKPKEGSLEFRV